MLRRQAKYFDWHRSFSKMIRRKLGFVLWFTVANESQEGLGRFEFRDILRVLICFTVKSSSGSSFCASFRVCSRSVCN